MTQVPFKYLTTAEMTSLSKTLCEDEKTKVLAIPMAAAVLPLLAAAHELVKNAKPVVTVVGKDARLGEISRDEKARDVRHDHSLTALHLLIQANIELESAKEQPDQDAIGALQSLDRALLPDGLGAAVHASYAAEAGNAEALEKRLADPAYAKLLGELSFKQGVTAAAVVAEHVANAHEIGKLEELRRVPAEEVDLRHARRTWITAARLMEAALDATGTDDAKALRAPLVEKTLEARATSLAATRKRAREAKDAKPTPAPAPTPPADGEKK